MARIRTIKPEFWRHEALCELPEATHMLAAALLNYADDFGFFNANPKLIQGEIYPLREPSVSVPESLRSLQAIGYIRLGTGADGRRYGQVTEFSKHQKVSHPTESKIEKISIAWDNSRNYPETSNNSQDVFRPEQGREQGREGKGITEEAKASSGGGAAIVGDDRPAWWPQRDKYGRVTTEITEKLIYDVGKSVLGNNAGGMITQLRKAYPGDMRAAIDFLLQAEEKSTPKEWLAVVIRDAELDRPQPPRHEIFPMETHH